MDDHWPSPPPTFGFRHVLGWLVYMLCLCSSLYFLWLTRVASDTGTWAFYLLPALLLFFPVLITGGSCVESWMVAANRSRIAWWLLLLTAMVSLGYALWMGKHNLYLMIGGAVTMFRRTNELWSITFGLFMPRLEGSIYSVVICVAYAWLCGRIMWVMLSGERDISMANVLQEKDFPVQPRVTTARVEGKSVPKRPKAIPPVVVPAPAPPPPPREQVLALASEILGGHYAYADPAVELMVRLEGRLSRDQAGSAIDEVRKAMSHTFDQMREIWCPIPPHPHNPYASPMEHARTFYPWMSETAVDRIMIWIKDYYLRG